MNRDSLPGTAAPSPPLESAPARDPAEAKAAARRGPAPSPPRSADAEAARLESEREDARNMRAFKEGDARAFERLLAKHRKPIYNFCLRMLHDRTAAEDAMQEVFLRVVRSAREWEQNAKLTTWLYTIARNHCIDALRKASYRKTASLDQTLGESEDRQATLGERVPDEESVTPDRGAESSRLRGRLVEAIASLSEEQREVFVMREYAGMPFKDIATVVGVPENTVKSRMRYALEHLRAHLAQLGVLPEGE